MHFLIETPQAFLQELDECDFDEGGIVYYDKVSAFSLFFHFTFTWGCLQLQFVPSF
uniref:Uncharacterized protein n=1 Tax=Rhizophora mucronata TaxID=61149 RepID=A0A2P2JI47_RHIMU